MSIKDNEVFKDDDVSTTHVNPKKC